MLTRMKNRFWLFAAFSLAGMVLVAAHITGCGGGTVSTSGDGSTRTLVSGLVQLQDGMPFGGANVIVKETGDGAIANQDGQFEFESNLDIAAVSFLVQKDAFEASTDVQTIVPQPSFLVVAIEVDQMRKEARVVSSHVQPRPTPTPHLDRTPGLIPGRPDRGPEVTPTPRMETPVASATSTPEIPDTTPENPNLPPLDVSPTPQPPLDASPTPQPPQSPERDPTFPFPLFPSYGGVVWLFSDLDLTGSTVFSEMFPAGMALQQNTAISWLGTFEVLREHSSENLFIDTSYGRFRIQLSSISSRATFFEIPCVLTPRLSDPGFGSVPIGITCFEEISYVYPRELPRPHVVDASPPPAPGFEAQRPFSPQPPYNGNFVRGFVSTDDSGVIVSQVRLSGGVWGGGYNPYGDYFDISMPRGGANFTVVVQSNFGTATLDLTGFTSMRTIIGLDLVLRRQGASGAVVLEARRVTTKTF